MADHIIPLPKSFHYLNQFASSSYAPSPSQYRCVSATLAMIGEIAYAGKDIPEKLEDEIYTHYAGPDVESDKQGMWKAQALDWMAKYGVGHIDYQSLVDEFAASNVAPLHSELMAGNMQGIPQLITVADESKLYQWGSNKKLHSWADGGMSHTMLRVGYSDNEGYGLYMEPAAPGFGQPVAISWQNLLDARIITAIAAMPGGVSQPPSGFLFQRGTWPVPTPTSDISSAETALEIALQAVKALSESLSQVQEALKAK